MDQTNNPAPPVRVSPQLVGGLILAGLGLLFTLDNLHILSARAVLRYWPAALVLLGISQFLQARSTAGIVRGSIWILIGAFLLGERLHLVSSVWRLWPLLLIVVGGYIAFQSFAGNVAPLSADAASRLSAIAILGGVDRRVASRTFAGGELTAFMGGGKVDLREAALGGPEAILNITAIMGGFEIKVPEAWSVIVEVLPFMGGYDDKTRHPADPSAPRLRIRGFVMMGGVEIRN